MVTVHSRVLMKSSETINSLTSVDTTQKLTLGFGVNARALYLWLIDFVCCIMVDALLGGFTWISATVFGLYQPSLNRPQNHTIEWWTADHGVCQNMQSAKNLCARKRSKLRCVLRNLENFLVCGYGLLYGLCRMKEIW